MSFPEKINNILFEYLSKRGYSSSIKEYDVISNWKDIVGKNISSVSNCLYVDNKILYVSVTSSSWRQEIIFLKKDILKKIRDIKQCTSIHDIIFLLFPFIVNVFYARIYS